jgi:oligogalacturonide lyase
MQARDRASWLAGTRRSYVRHKMGGSIGNNQANRSPMNDHNVNQSFARQPRHTDPAHGSRRGTRLAPEKRVLRDARTGALIWQLTDAPCINHAPYFLNPAWAGPRRDLLIVTSYRTGGPNLYGIQLPDGELLQLTDSGDISPWSACVAPDGRYVYFTAGGNLHALDLETLSERVLTTLPPSSWLGNCSIRPDGSEVALIASRNGVNALLACRTDTGEVRTLYETPALLAHAQWSPDGERLLFASDLPRMWLVEAGGRHPRPLRPQTRQEWLVHEAWLTPDEIIFTHWPHALKAIRRDGSGERTIAPFNCWHPAPRAGGRQIVCDTTLPDSGLQLVDPSSGARRTLCYPSASSQGYQWSQPEPIWEGPVPEAAYGPQWTHPHPSFTPDGRAAVYTSDVTGFPQVYLAHVDAPSPDAGDRSTPTAPA